MTIVPPVRRWKLQRISSPLATLAYAAIILPPLTMMQSLHAQTNGLQAADQRLMDSERALLHSLSARTFANSNSQAAAPVAAKVAISESAPVIKAPAKTEIKAPVVPVKASAPVTAAQPAVEQKVVQKVEQATEAVPAKPKVPVEQKVEKKAPSNGDVEILKNSNSNLRRELQSAQQRVEELERSLDQARSQLALTETELSRLSVRLDSKNRASLGKYNLPIVGNQAAPAGAASGGSGFDTARMKAPTTEVRPPAANTEMPVATVAVDKADLRLGPGKNHSALMAVPRGSRLVVETRQGEWYRVFAPSGERAWIQAGMVLFGDGASVLNDGTASRIKGFNPNDEEEAFRRVQRITAGQ